MSIRDSVRHLIVKGSERETFVVQIFYRCCWDLWYFIATTRPSNIWAYLYSGWTKKSKEEEEALGEEEEEFVTTTREWREIRLLLEILTIVINYHNKMPFLITIFSFCQIYPNICPILSIISNTPLPVVFTTMYIYVLNILKNILYYYLGSRIYNYP